MTRADEKHKDFTSVAILVLSFKVYNAASFSTRVPAFGKVEGMRLTGSTALALGQAAPDGDDALGALPCPFLATTMSGLGGYNSSVLGCKAEGITLHVQ